MRRITRITLTPLSAVLASALAIASPPPAHAAGETFTVSALESTGCASGQFYFTAAFAGLDGGPAYTVHTVVTAGGLIYMNEAAVGPTNGPTSWGLFDNFGYGAVPNRGTWPIPAGVPMQVDVTLERPMGGPPLHRWRTVVDGCTTGNILYNNEASLDTDGDLLAVPADQCPGAASPTPNGCPQIARQLTLKYKTKAQQFRGQIKSAAAALGNTQQVTIYRKRPGADKKIGRTKTDGNGRFRLTRSPGRGTYYAVALAVIDPNAGQTADVASKTVRLR